MPYMFFSRASKQAVTDAVTALRAHLAFFGCRVADITDDDLIAGAVRMQAVMRASAISTAAAAAASAHLNRALTRTSD